MGLYSVLAIAQTHNNLLFSLAVDRVIRTR